jgi:endo-1,4-beta-mannosidase
MSIRFGVNYLPRQNWWYEWAEDDSSAFDDDLRQLSDLGFDHIRIQCLWPLFQPNPDWISPRALRRLSGLLDAAADHRLAVCVTVLDGWLSGFDFRPEWLKDSQAHTDEAAVTAAELLVATVAEHIAGHPALWCIDIANEPNVLMTRLPGRGGEDWASRMMGAARTAGAPVTMGVDHVPWMADASPLSREFVVAESDIVSIHSWPFFTGALDAVGEERAWAIPDYLAQVARATAGGTHKPLWIQELGVSELWLARTDPADFAEAMLRRAAAVPGVEAITWWASHDISRRFAGFDELEYGLGLIDEHGGLKPIGRRVVDVMHQLRSSPAPAPQRAEAMMVPSGHQPDIHLAKRWFERMDPVVGPAIAFDDPSHPGHDQP